MGREGEGESEGEGKRRAGRERARERERERGEYEGRGGGGGRREEKGRGKEREHCLHNSICANYFGGEIYRSESRTLASTVLNYVHYTYTRGESTDSVTKQLSHTGSVARGSTGKRGEGSNLPGFTWLCPEGFVSCSLSVYPVTRECAGVLSNYSDTLSVVYNRGGTKENVLIIMWCVPISYSASDVLVCVAIT